MGKLEALEVAKNYIKALCDSDISRIDGIQRNPNLARNILRAYARQISTIDSDQTLYNDIRANNTYVSDKTIIDYINVFKKLFIIEEISAWNPNIRSKTVIRTSPKKTFIDPSLATAVLGFSLEDGHKHFRIII